MAENLPFISVRLKISGDYHFVPLCFVGEVNGWLLSLCIRVCDRDELVKLKGWVQAT